MRYLSFLLIALLLASCKSIPPPFAEYHSLREATVLFRDGDGYGIGTGVVIEEGRVLTAAHVALSAVLVERERIKGVGYSVAWYNKWLDLAEVRFKISCPCVKVAERTGRRYERIVTVGYPQNLHVDSQIITEGMDQGLSRSFNRRNMTASITGGNSGGGVFAYRDGWELIGMTTSVLANFYTEVNHLAFYSPVYKRLLNVLSKTKR